MSTGAGTYWTNNRMFYFTYTKREQYLIPRVLALKYRRLWKLLRELDECENCYRYGA